MTAEVPENYYKDLANKQRLKEKQDEKKRLEIREKYLPKQKKI